MKTKHCFCGKGKITREYTTTEVQYYNDDKEIWQPRSEIELPIVEAIHFYCEVCGEEYYECEYCGELCRASESYNSKSDCDICPECYKKENADNIKYIDTKK